MKEKNITKSVFIDKEKSYQTIEGWGTSLAWWANMVGGWNMPGESGREKRQELMDLIFDTEKGLGMNIVRYNIGGGDAPSHDHIKRIEAVIPGYKAAENQEYDWEADGNQVWVLQQAVEKRRKYGNDVIVEAFSNTPPYWMTVSGCASGNTDPSKDNIKENYYDTFAKYLVDITKYFKDTLGINFDYLEPVNESASSYWAAYSPKQEGAHFDQGDSQSKIYRSVYKELSRQGLLNDVKLTGTDETNIDHSIESFLKLTDEVKGYIEKINTHAYGGSKREELRELAVSYDKKLWMSEVCISNGAYDIDSMSTPIALTEIILKDLKELKATGWVFWQVVESKLECLNSRETGGNWGLIHGIYEEKPVEGYHKVTDIEKPEIIRGDYTITKQFYVLCQFTRFIKLGYKIIGSDNNNVVAAISPEGNEIVIVVLNSTEEEQSYEFCLKEQGDFNNRVKTYRTSDTERLSSIDGVSLEQGKYLKTILPKRSLSTFILKTKE